MYDVCIYIYIWIINIYKFYILFITSSASIGWTIEPVAWLVQYPVWFFKHWKKYAF